MSAARALALVLGLPLVLGLFLAMAGWVWVRSAFPPDQGPRLRGPHDLVGIRTGSNGTTYAWVVPTKTGVVLIDAGFEPDARAILDEIDQRPIHAVLLTHAHPGHILGLQALPNTVPVYAAPAELDVLGGKTQQAAPLARFVASTLLPITHTGPVVPVVDGQEIEIDGVRILAKYVPGHSAASVVYLWEDVLFTGDAVFGGPRPSMAPEASAADPAQAKKSLERLVPLDFQAIADGHVGITTTARPALLRLAGVEPVGPSISMRTAGPAGRLRTEREGTYVQAPVDDVRGQRPALLVFDDGSPSWRLSDRPVPDHASWAGKRVIVAARGGPPGPGPGIPVDVDGVRAASEPADERSLSERAGQVVKISGEAHLVPLTPGARWGEGQIRLDNGASVGLAAPLDRLEAGRIDGYAKVVRGAEDRIRLVLLPGS